MKTASRPLFAGLPNCYSHAILYTEIVKYKYDMVNGFYNKTGEHVQADSTRGRMYFSSESEAIAHSNLMRELKQTQYINIQIIKRN